MVWALKSHPSAPVAASSSSSAAASAAAAESSRNGGVGGVETFGAIWEGRAAGVCAFFELRVVRDEGGGGCTAVVAAFAELRVERRVAGFGAGVERDLRVERRSGAGASTAAAAAATGAAATACFFLRLLDFCCALFRFF